MKIEARTCNQTTLRNKIVLILLCFIAGMLTAFVAWRLYLAFEIVKFIFEIILFPFKHAGDIFGGNGP